MKGQRRSHPPSLLRSAERTIRDQGLICPGERVLAGVSGGPDSMALMHVLGILSKRLHFEVVACGVNHGLRDEAASELALAARQAEEWGLVFQQVMLSVKAGPNLMARAREARLQALQEMASGLSASKVALGHHADDRAETVILRLFRGAGPAGLAVMPARCGNVIRPFINTGRDAIEKHLARHKVPFATDPSNSDPRFERTAVRTQVLPLMKQICPRVVEHLCNLAGDLGALELPRGGLGRAQLTAFAQAAAEGHGRIKVALPGGRVAHFEPETGKIEVVQRQ